MTDTKLIHATSMMSLFGRIIALAIIIFLWSYGGFRPDEFRTLLFILTPLTVLFFSAFIRFMVKYPYPISIQSFQPRLGKITLYIPLAIYLLYSLAIVGCSLDRSFISYATLTGVLLTGECGFAIYAAIFLGKLFLRFPLD